MSYVNTSRLAGAATAVAMASAITMLPTPAQAAPCSQWAFPGGFQLNQADGWHVKIPTSGPNAGPGSADYWKEDKNDPSNGIPTGGVTGNKIRIVIPWSNGSTGTFTGDIAPDGGVTNGTSMFTSGFQTSWTTQKMICADKPPVQGEQPQPQPPAQKANQRKAKDDVNIESGPGANAVIVGMLNEGEVVEVEPGCRDDIKCVVIGRGWVWGDHLVEI